MAVKRLDTEEKLLYSIEEASRLLSMSRAQVYRLIDACQIGSVKIGRSRRISRSQLDAFVRSLELASPTQDRFVLASQFAKRPALPS